MKQFLYLLFVISLLFQPPIAKSQDRYGGFELNGVYYSITTSPDKTTQKVTVTWKGTFYDSYSNEYAGDIVIPTSVAPKDVTYYVTEIRGQACKDCTTLTSIAISNGVIGIYGGAFAGCTGLKSVSIPASTKQINSDAFRGCYSLASVVIDSLNSVYDCRNNCNAIIKTSTNELIHGCQNTEIPNSVTSIGSYAFYNNSNLKNIEIPNSVTSIGNYAFSGCSMLNELIIPGSVTSTGSYAFSNCTNLVRCVISNGVNSVGFHSFNGCINLKNLIFPESLTTIYEHAFSGCNNLDSIKIPNNVTSIKGYAFANCSNLKSVIVESTTPPSASSTSFKNIQNDATLYVPMGTKTVYAKAAGWKDFPNIVEINTTTLLNKIQHNDNNIIVVACYDIHGRKLSEPAKGVNIIKMSDGTTRKELVR